MQKALLLLLLVLFVQSVGAQVVTVDHPAKTSLYFHLNGFQDFPINTQKPEGGDAPEPLGLTTNTVSCVPDTPVAGLTHARYHTYYGLSSPSFVEYNFTEDGRPRIHDERGLAGDVSINMTQPLRVVWFMATHTGVPSGQKPDPNSAPVVVPQVAVRVTMRTGENIAAGEEGYNSGAIIAQGESGVATLAGAAATSGATYSQVNGTNVYAVEVTLKFAGAASLPSGPGFSLRIDVFEKVPGDVACNDPSAGSIMPNVVRPYTDQSHRPRMELTVNNPLSVLSFKPMVRDGNATYAMVEVQSPWGNYDVDVAGASLWLVNADAAAGTERLQPLQRVAVVQRYAEYDHFRNPVVFTWALPANIPAGQNTLRFSGSNLQHSANITVEMPLDARTTATSPMPAAPVLVIALMAVGLVMQARTRRERRQI